MHFFNNIVKFRSLKNFQSISVNIENPVWLNFCMATLNQTFVSIVFVLTFGVNSIFLEIKPFHFFFPFFLDYLYYSVFLSLLFGSSIYCWMYTQIWIGLAFFCSFFLYWKLTASRYNFLTLWRHYVIIFNTWEFFAQNLLEINILFNRVAFKSNLIQRLQHFLAICLNSFKTLYLIER